MYKENILVLTQWGYEEGLIQSYTLPYLRIIRTVSPGAKIFLQTQEKTGLLGDPHKLERIKKELEKEDIFLVAQEYEPLGVRKYLRASLNFLAFVKFIKKNKVGYIHAFCTPSGSYGYLLAKITGAKLIIDSYEPHSEYMKESGVWKEKSFPYKVLSLFEKLQVQKASHVIATTKGVIRFTEDRFDLKLKHAYIKPACVNMELFHYEEADHNEIRDQYHLHDKLVCVFAGKFGGTYLEVEVFDFFKAAEDFWGDRFRVLLLTGASAEELRDFCSRSGFSYDKITHLSVHYAEVHRYLAAADFAFTPVRPTPSKRFCTPVKDGEYWAMGLPVVITKGISDDSDIIEEHKIGSVIPELNENGYKTAIREMDRLLQQPQKELRQRIQAVAKQYRHFSIAEDIYSRIY